MSAMGPAGGNEAPGMAAFNESEIADRRDWLQLRSGAISLYFRPEILAEDVTWLREHQYEVYSFDCAAWETEADFHDEVNRQLSFPGYYGHNLHAFSDCLSQLNVPEAGGLALQLMRIDQFASRLPAFAWDVLDIIEHNSRDFLLTGRRFIALAQTDDPRLCFDPVGARRISWNPREWLNKNRGL
jgi:RNAse (barnase) inhibitor barstar